MKYSFDEKVVEKLLDKVEQYYSQHSYDCPRALAESTVERILDSYVEQIVNVLYQTEFGGDYEE